MTELAQVQHEADKQDRAIWHHTGGRGGYWVYPQGNGQASSHDSYQAASIVVVQDGQLEMTITTPKPVTLVEVREIFHRLRHRMAFCLRKGVITATII
jgi:hypothetical protein